MRELYDLYMKCFPEYPVTCALFMDLLRPDEASLHCEHVGGSLAGYAMVHNNSVSLICVDRRFRRQGIGTALLNRAEADIASKGFDNIILGRGAHYLLQGVPADAENHVVFFEKRGYSAAWTSVNMTLPLKDFDISSLDIPSAPADVSYHLIDAHEPSARAALLEAVSDAMPAWRGIYEKCNDPVFVAERSGSIVGFQILAPNGARFSADGEKAGSIGCVGVVPSERRRGTGRRMVADGAHWLKEQGCSAIELRYVELVGWYEKLGFKVNRRQWMGEKRL